MVQKILKRKEREDTLDLDEQIKLKPDTKLNFPSQKRLSKESIEARSEAEKIIQEAYKEAHKIKVQAKDLMDRVKANLEELKEKSLREGREEGLSSVTEMIVAAKEKEDKLGEDLKDKILILVYDITEKILGREFKERESAIIDLIKEALQASTGQKITVLINPQDFEKVKKQQQSLFQSIDANKSLNIRSDEKVKANGCLIETEIGTIDAQLETQLEAIKKALGLAESS